MSALRRNRKVTIVRNERRENSNTVSALTAVEEKRRRLYIGDEAVAGDVLGCSRETALQGALVLAKSGKLEMGDNILPTL